MAQTVLSNAKVMLGASDISAYVKAVNLDYSVETPDATKMGDTTKNSIVGMKDIKCSLDLHQDYADNGLDEIIFGLIGTAVAVAIRPANTTVSASNPEYQFTGFVSSHSPISGSVGDNPSTKVTITPSGGGALVRAVA